MNTHLNDERTVHCPIEGCEATPLARGVHLHVMRSSGNGHGPQGEVPDHVSFDALETAGAREVSMDYPETRETEKVMRLCPECHQPFHGKHGVQIHLGLVAGKHDHPDGVRDHYEPDDFPIAHVDRHGNVKEIVEGEVTLPTTEQRKDADERLELIEKLHERGIIDDDELEDARRLVA